MVCALRLAACVALLGGARAQEALILCTPPENLEGYSITSSEMNAAAFLVEGQCAEGYTGALEATACTEDGPYTIAGCQDAQDKSCAHSASDNHVVTDDCVWHRQEFTHASGSLGGGVGYMCAGKYYRGDCTYQVRVEGTAAAGHGTHGRQVTLNSGDAVFCSACLAADPSCQSETSGSIREPSPPLLLLALAAVSLRNG